jgi:hypothetical protein
MGGKNVILRAVQEPLRCIAMDLNIQIVQALRRSRDTGHGERQSAH